MESPRKETVLYFKLTAKQIGTELLTRVISVCPWTPASERHTPSNACVSVCLGRVSISLDYGRYGPLFRVLMRCKTCISLCFVLAAQVIKISALGHRKRIIASLAERPYEEAPTKSRRLSPIMVRLLMRKTVKPSLFPEIDWLA